MDTSTLVRRYLAETGFQWVRDWINPSTGNSIIISELTMVEMVSLFARQEKARNLKPHAAARLRQAFLAHAEQDYMVTIVDSTILLDARAIASKYALRALDAIQLTCAVQSKLVLRQHVTVISADNELLAAATAEGFNVDNPFLHP